jgi:hypothetical protein
MTTSIMHEEVNQGWLGGAGMYSYVRQLFCRARTTGAHSTYDKDKVTCPDCIKAREHMEARHKVYEQNRQKRKDKADREAFAALGNARSQPYGCHECYFGVPGPHSGH